MEVTHINHLDTHAIIGGTGKVQTFSTKQDAEFFEILSSTLYSNKELAVVREVLCNSWDANIEGNKEHKHVIVEISDSKMTFQDFGPGIPADKMGEIYCTYGGSTKRHDGKKTGGFGLGSKAPFAYAKNFTVTTINGGYKSVFNISRGTSATNGVPDLRCMVSVPSTEPSGVTVYIPILATDQQNFIELVKAVAFMGGMLVKLNGSTLKRITYNTELPFILVPLNDLPPHLHSKNESRAYHRSEDTKYFVKYGAVVYPIPEQFTASRSITVEAGTQLIRQKKLAVVFIAPPDSIGITPSRESLSMTDKTVETLKSLFAASSQAVKKVLPDVIESLVPLYKAKMKDSMNVSDMSSSTLLQVVKNPKVGYEHWCDQVKYRNAITASNTLVQTIEALRNHLLFEYEVNAWGQKRVADILYKEDPDGSKMLRMVKKEIIRQNPLYGLHLYHAALKGKKLDDEEHKCRMFYLRKLARLCNFLEKQGGVVAHMQVRGWDNDHYSGDRVLNEIAENKNNRYYGGRLSNLVNYFLNNEKTPHLGYATILLCQSQASVDRVLKAEGISRGDSRAFILVTARKKKDYERMKKLLVDTMKMKNVKLIPEMDVLPKPLVVLKRQYLLRYENNQPRAVARTIEDTNLYIYTPSSYLIPGVEGTKLNQGKLVIEPIVGRLLCYLYPNLVLVPGVADANELESKGYRNVFQVFAEEVEEFFNDPSNHEILLNNLTDVRGYFRNYNLSAILRFMTVPKLLEVLGKNPQYFNKDRDLPVLILTFFALLTANLTPKFGIQYLHRAADRTKNIFDSFFGDEINRIVDDPMMVAFMSNMPSAHDKVKDEAIPVIVAGISAAMQTTILHQNLRKKAPK